MVRGQKSGKTARIASVKAMKLPSRMPSRANGFGDRNNNNYTNSRSAGGSSTTQPKQFNNQSQLQQQNHTQSLQRQKSIGSTSSGSNITQAKDLREMLNSKKNLKTNLQQVNMQQKTTTATTTSTAKHSALASKVVQPQQHGKVQQRLNDQQQQQNQSVGPRPILGASKQSQQNTESQNSADGKKSEVKSQQQKEKLNSSESNKVDKSTTSSMESKVLKPQQRLNAIQNNFQQQQQIKTVAVQAQPTPTAKKSTTAAAYPAAPTQKPLPSTAQIAPSYNAMEQTKPNATSSLQSRLKVYVKPDYNVQVCQVMQFFFFIHFS